MPWFRAASASSAMLMPVAWSVMAGSSPLPEVETPQELGVEGDDDGGQARARAGAQPLLDHLRIDNHRHAQDLGSTRTGPDGPSGGGQRHLGLRAGGGRGRRGGGRAEP